MLSSRAPGALVRSTVVLLLLAACSSAGSPAGPDEQDGSSTAPAPSTDPAPAPEALASFDAPREFDGDPVPIALDAVESNLAGDFVSRFVLVGDRAYGVGPGGVGAVDLASGETLWETPFVAGAEPPTPSPLYDERGPGAPVPSEDGTAVLAAAAVVVPGSGTTKDVVVLRVVGLDTSSGAPVWQVDVPAPEEVTGTSSVPVRVVSADADRVLVALDGDGLTTAGLVAAIDPVGQELRWVRDGVLQVATSAALLVVATPDGSSYPQLVGVDPATGADLWAGGTDVSTSVTSVAAVETSAGVVHTPRTYSGAEAVTVLLDPLTGTVLGEPADVALLRPQQDGDRVYDVSGGAVRALDPASLTPLWELPSADRVAPSHPVFYGGLVYGGVGGGLGVVLDGTSGADVTVDVVGTFVGVGEHGALVLRDGETFFLPATA